MSKSVIINGVTYNDIPYVSIPLAGGTGNAKFADTDSGDAAAGDLRNGKKAWVDGAEVTGSVPVKSSADVTASGKTVTVPAGIYDAQVQKAVGDGSVTPSAALSGDEIGTTVSDYPIVATPSAAVSAGFVSAAGTGSPVTKYIQVESKSVTPSTAAQTIMPSSGKLIKSVLVAAVNVTATATEATVPAGVTFFANSLTKKTGTATFPAVAQDSSTKVLSIS